MSVLLFGVSHRSAPVSILEQLSTDESDQAKIVDQVLQSSLVTEAMVLSTCNRVEVYAVAEANHTVGRTLHELSQRALSVGKRVHSETGIDRAGASVVSVALEMAETKLGSLAGRSAVVVGAGSMGSLSAKQLARLGVDRIHIVN